MTPTAVATVATWIDTDWPYGTRIERVTPGVLPGSAVAAVSSSDGSYWWISTDRYGAHRVQADTLEQVGRRLVAAVSAHAAHAPARR